MFRPCPEFLAVSSCRVFHDVPPFEASPSPAAIHSLDSTLTPLVFRKRPGLRVSVRCASPLRPTSVATRGSSLLPWVSLSQTTFSACQETFARVADLTVQLRRTHPGPMSPGTRNLTKTASKRIVCKFEIPAVARDIRRHPCRRVPCEPLTALPGSGSTTSDRPRAPQDSPSLSVRVYSIPRFVSRHLLIFQENKDSQSVERHPEGRRSRGPWSLSSNSPKRVRWSGRTASSV